MYSRIVKCIPEPVQLMVKAFEEKQPGERFLKYRKP